jgi:hypothetical protein
VTSDADATPAGIAVIARAKAHSSVRTATRVFAGLNPAAWQCRTPKPDSLDRHDLTVPNASNGSEPPEP